MIRALQRLVRFMGWITAREKLELDAADSADPLRSVRQPWLFAREQLPEPPQPPESEAGPVVAHGWWRFFLAPEPHDAGALHSSAPGKEPVGRARSFPTWLFSREALGGEDAASEPVGRARSFPRWLCAREALGDEDAASEPVGRARSFPKWLFSREAIDGNETGKAPSSRRG